MNNKLKYLFAVILAVLLAVITTVCASAEEYGKSDEENGYSADNIYTLTETKATAEGGLLLGYEAEDNVSVATDDIGEREEMPNGKDEAVGSLGGDENIYTDNTDSENLFSKMYAELTSYASEILCALTFLGSIVLAVAYKKGLLPLVEKSLVAIGNAVTKIKDNAKESIDKSSLIYESIDERLTTAKETIDMLVERIDELTRALDGCIKDESEARREKKQLRLLADAQIDMLYNVFMSSALPQYQKDAVGEKIAKMKEAIAENEREE